MPVKVREFLDVWKSANYRKAADKFCHSIQIAEHEAPGSASKDEWIGIMSVAREGILCNGRSHAWSMMGP